MPQPKKGPPPRLERQGPSGGLKPPLQGFGDDEGYVVVLLAGAELVDFVDYSGEQVVGGKGAVAAERVGETFFAEFIAPFVEGFGDAVGVESENVARRKLDFADVAVPVLKGADNRGGSFEARKRIVAAQQQGGKVAAVGVAQAAGGVVVLGEKQRGERAVRGVLAKQLVHGAQPVRHCRGPATARAALREPAVLREHHGRRVRHAVFRRVQRRYPQLALRQLRPPSRLAAARRRFVCAPRSYRHDC